MYCQSCGREMASGLTACTSCGYPVPQAQVVALPAQEIGERLLQHAKSASQDAWRALRVLALNPVGGLRSAFDGLSQEQARNVAVAFAIAFDLCLVVGGTRALSAFRGGWFSSAGFSFGTTLGLLIAGLVPFLGISGAFFLARKIFHTGTRLEGELFIAGTALLPVAACLLLTGVLGIGNFEILSLLTVFALCYTVILLYTGCREIAGLPPGSAALAVPVVLLISFWLTKMVFVALP